MFSIVGGWYSNNQSKLRRDKEIHMITPPLVAEVGNCRQKDHGEEEEQNSYEISVSVTASLLCEYWAKKKKKKRCFVLVTRP